MIKKTILYLSIILLTFAITNFDTENISFQNNCKNYILGFLSIILIIGYYTSGKIKSK